MLLQNRPKSPAKLSWVCFILLFVTTVTNAGSDTFVPAYFQSLQSLRAEFVQTVFDDQGRLIETSTGKMLMQKPRRFRWDYQSPFEQLIVADGERLWIYDRELQQVTVKALDEAMSSTPLALLSGAVALDEWFTVTPMKAPEKATEHLQWHELRSKKAQDEFNLLRVAFNNETLAIIELEDTFNRRTRIELRALERNVAIAADLLRFTPPADADVVGDIP